jgi:ketosteroid isomerase-like protein
MLAVMASGPAPHPSNHPAVPSRTCAAMPLKPPPSVLADGSPNEVEAAFYEALQQGDITKLMAVWADDDEIVCVHPGGPRVIGPGAIRASFEAIFAHNAIPVEPEQVHRLHTVGSAVHHLVERIRIPVEGGEQTAWVLATNVYLRTAAGWRLVAHHASPGVAYPLPPGGDAPTTLH